MTSSIAAIFWLFSWLHSFSAVILVRASSNTGRILNDIRTLTPNVVAASDVDSSGGISGGISHRQGKYLFILRTDRGLCQSKLDGLTGNCLPWKYCKRSGGEFGGFCAFGIGSCCVFRRSCGSRIQHNNTYFQSKDFPSAFHPSGLQSCTTRILKLSDNVCQVRLDFLSTELEGPDSNGVCRKDRVLFSNGPTPGTASAIGPNNLCGPLSGQSVYLDFGTNQEIGLTYVTDGNQASSPRRWNVRTTYIECDSTSRAPTGCLQYNTGVVGQVKILGYPQRPHLGDLGYAVCVRAEPGARGISWRQCAAEPEDQSFWFNGGPASGGRNPQETCPGGDFIMIPQTATAGSDRLCGNSLTGQAPPASIVSFDQPFILRVRTDGIENEQEEGNTGFCLEWNQEF